MKADKQRDAGMLLMTQVPDWEPDSEFGVSHTYGSLIRQRRLQQAAQHP